MRFPTADGVVQALGVIEPVFLNTPMRDSWTLDRALGASLVFKDETANPIRSFKGRGAENFAASLAREQTLVCASAGNFGQGLAWAACRRGMRLIVFAAEGAVACKIAAMRNLGADVRLKGHDFDAAKEEARTFAETEGLVFVEDGAEASIAEGAGTLAFELTEAADPFEIVIAPLGNGALAAGVGAWIKHASPRTRVTAAAAAGAPAMAESMRAGEIVETESTHTIADGIAVRVPIPYAVEAARNFVDDVVLVSDADIRTAMELVRDHLDLIVEPAGAAGLAAVVAEPQRWAGRRIFVPLCGGNMDQA
jgi:threonine dehydratase